ncbi:MAG TPA: hypothetical protein PKD46_16145 [Aggregatilineaceae bacterium]|nr:hypothetical protein [Aggregatilineaceae bacterium]
MGTRLMVEVDWAQDGTWVDETGRLIALRGRVGLGAPRQHMPEIGRMALELDNFDGRYDAGNASGPLYGRLLPGRAARVRAEADGGEWWAVFTGWIERIDLHAGGGGAAITLVDAVARLHGAALAVDYAPSAGLVDCLAGLVEAAYPAAWTDYAGEGETLEHVGWRWLPERTTIWEGVRDVVRTWHGRFWVARWGGPSYRGRAWLQEASEAPALAVGASGGAQDAVPDALDTALDVARVINAAQVVTYPVEQVAAEGVLWESSGVLRLAPGETRTLPALFRDARGERCAAVEVAAPVPQADYRVSEFRDGSGVDYTTDPAFDLAVTVEATRARLAFTNTATGALYVQFFRLRGKPVLAQGPVISEAADAASQASYQKRAVVIDLPMQADAAFGQGLAEHLVRRYGAPAVEARRVTFRDRDVVAGVNLYGLELMDPISVTDAASGLEDARHRVIAIEVEAARAARQVTLWLERCDDRTYWRLGRAARGALGRTTRLGL